MKPELSIVKIGGKLIEDPGVLDDFLNHFARLSGHKILVHGGGTAASAYEKKLGLVPKMTDGRRITDAKSLEVVTMVYAGLINKKITAALQGRGCNAFGLTGADGNVISAQKREVKSVDYGFAGDVAEVNTRLIKSLLDLGLTPVFCPITHDCQGQLLNTNADTIAAELAVSLSEEYTASLYYCFDKIGVLQDQEDEESLIRVLNISTYLRLKDESKISSGMLPKLKNCFHALKGGASAVRLGNYAMLTSDNDTKTEVVL